MKLLKNKRERSNKKNINYIPLKLEDSLIIAKAKSKSEFSRVIKIENLDEIKKVIAITNYRNRYKLFMDIDVGAIKYYIVETVFAENISEANEKFKMDSEEKIQSKELIEILRDFYRKVSFCDKEIQESNARNDIAPFELKFKDDYFSTDKYFGIVSAVERFKDELFDLDNIIHNIKFRTLISVDFKRVNEEKILKTLKSNLEKGEEGTLIPTELKCSLPRTIEKLENSVTNKCGLILYSFTIIQLAETLENAKEYNQYLKKVFKYNGMHLIELVNNQKKGLNYTLLYGIDNTDIKLVLEENKFINIFNLK